MAFQARSLRLNDDLSAALRALTVQLVPGPGPEEVELDATVADRRWVKGHDAYEVRVHVKFRHQVANSGGGHPALFDLAVPDAAEVDWRRSYWISAEVAYPILVVDQVLIDRASSFSRELVLVAARLGNGPIPWSANPVPALQWERSGADSTVPGDGTSGAFCFPLSRAARLANDATQVRLAAWRAANPDARLIGAAGECSKSGDSFWHLFYGTPAGSAHAVMIRGSYGAGQAPLPTAAMATQALYEGDWMSPPFEAADLPSDLVTISEVERVVRILSQSALVPTSVYWGVNQFVGTYPQWLLPGRTIRGSSAVLEILAERAEARPGGIQGGSVHGLEILVDLHAGEVLGGFEGKTGWERGASEVTRITHPREGTPIGPQAVAPDSGVRSKALGGAVLLGGSVFATLSAILFLPLLKAALPNLVGWIPGYAKLRRAALLDHATRERLLQEITADPGISPPELQQRQAIGWSTLVYHLSVLEKNRFISSLIDGRHKRLFAVEAMDWSRRSALAMLRDQKSRAVFQLVKGAPGITQRDIVYRAGMSSTGSLWHLSRLQRAGLVAREKRGRRVHYFPTAEAAPHSTTRLPGVEVV